MMPIPIQWIDWRYCLTRSALAALVCFCCSLPQVLSVLQLPARPTFFVPPSQRSVQEKVRMLKAAAPSVRDGTNQDYAIFLEDHLPEYALANYLEVLNAAIDLAPFGNADAEYTVGVIWETRSQWQDVFARDYAPYTAKCWYSKAAEHGSAQAFTALACMMSPQNYAQTTEQIRLLRKAIELGDPSAKVYLGLVYKGSSRFKNNYKQAMELFEEATRTNDREAVTWALSEALRLWNEGKAVPSNEFRSGAKGVFEFLQKYAPELQEEEFREQFFKYEPYPSMAGQLRWEVLSKVRKQRHLS